MDFCRGDEGGGLGVGAKEGGGEGLIEVNKRLE